MERADRLRIAKPCGASWEAMEGDEKSRFCPECGKHVYNVSAMKRAEIAGLVAGGEPDGPLPCVRGACDSDGYLLSAGKLAAVSRRSFTMSVAGAIGGMVPVAALAQVEGVVVSGVVRDASGAGIPKARLTLVNSGQAETQAETRVSSDETGAFRFTGVRRGTYQLKAESPGFVVFRKEAVEIRGETAVELQLQLQVGTMGGPVADVIVEPSRLKLPSFLKRK